MLRILKQGLWRKQFGSQNDAIQPTVNVTLKGNVPGSVLLLIQ